MHDVPRTCQLKSKKVYQLFTDIVFKILRDSILPIKKLTIEIFKLRKLSVQK